MRLIERGSLLSPLFSIEFHSADPVQMARFYEETLSLRFKRLEYPCETYYSRMGPLAIIISGLSPGVREKTSVPGKCTLGLLVKHKPGLTGEKFFLYPRRPLGRAWPSQYATRVTDPDGNYLALATCMEETFGTIPPLKSFKEITVCALEYFSLKIERMFKRMRSSRDRAVDGFQYQSNSVFSCLRQLPNCTHVVASREGLYMVGKDTCTRVLRGSFFGTTIRGTDIYCFQSCGEEQQNKGRILKLQWDAVTQRVRRVDVVAKGLDDGCHQIDFIGDKLYVVDCYNGRIIEIDTERPGEAYRVHYPLGVLSRDVANDVYHMNSLAAHPDGTIWLLLHNHNRTPSEVVVVNRQFEVQRRFCVPAGSAHNIVFTGDSLEYLIADSSGARVVSALGPVTDIEMMRPRGISLDSELCVIGDSFFSERPFRRYVPGRVHFFDRKSWKCLATLSVPGAPTEIRRIDGRDLSISNFLMERVTSDERQKNCNVSV